MITDAKLKKIKRYFKKADPKICAVLTRMELEPLKGERDHKRYFEKLCREIISQQLADKAARAIRERFLALFPSHHPTPVRVAALSEKKLRAVGMSWAKARYLRDLALKTKSGTLQFRNLHRMSDAEVIAELTKVKGIGPWTAEMFLIFTLGREDVFSFGDLGLQKGFARVHGTPHSQRHFEQVVAHWSPYRSYAALALWHVNDV